MKRRGAHCRPPSFSEQRHLADLDETPRRVDRKLRVLYGCFRGLQTNAEARMAFTPHAGRGKEIKKALMASAADPNRADTENDFGRTTAI